MNIVKIKYWSEIPENYTGIVEESQYGNKYWVKENRKLHREDGPAEIWLNNYKEWWLNGKYIWHSGRSKIFLKNKIILSKDLHPEYPTVQVLKYIDEYGIQERIIIPGMEKWFIE